MQLVLRVTRRGTLTSAAPRYDYLHHLCSACSTGMDACVLAEGACVKADKPCRTCSLHVQVPRMCIIAYIEDACITCACTVYTNNAQGLSREVAVCLTRWRFEDNVYIRASRELAPSDHTAALTNTLQQLSTLQVCLAFHLNPSTLAAHDATHGSMKTRRNRCRAHLLYCSFMQSYSALSRVHRCLQHGINRLCRSPRLRAFCRARGSVPSD